MLFRKQAFYSVYSLFRTGSLEYFYYKSHQFSVLFVLKRSLGIAEDGFCAYLSKATKGLRKMLQSEDIKFEISSSKTTIRRASSTFNPAVVQYELEDETDTEDYLKELEEFEKIMPGKTYVISLPW